MLASEADGLAALRTAGAVTRARSRSPTATTTRRRGLSSSGWNWRPSRWTLRRDARRRARRAAPPAAGEVRVGDGPFHRRLAAGQRLERGLAGFLAREARSRATAHGHGQPLSLEDDRPRRAAADRLRRVLPHVHAEPSLLHGDLWGGNAAALADGTPVAFDPAVYCGDREADLAMTELFGGFPKDFHAAYRAAWALDDGYSARRDFYNLYHVLNHANLFAGGYVAQGGGSSSGSSPRSARHEARDRQVDAGPGPACPGQARAPRDAGPAGARGAAEGATGEGAPLRVLVLGDSAGAGVGAASQDEALTGRIVAGLVDRFRVEWRLVARTGATTASTFRHLERAEAFATDVVVTSLGVNDVTGNVGVERFLRQQAALFALLRGKFGARLILASGIPPMDRFPALPQPLRWYLGARAGASLTGHCRTTCRMGRARSTSRWRGNWKPRTWPRMASTRGRPSTRHGVARPCGASRSRSATICQTRRYAVPIRQATKALSRSAP